MSSGVVVIDQSGTYMIEARLNIYDTLTTWQAAYVNVGVFNGSATIYMPVGTALPGTNAATIWFGGTTVLNLIPNDRVAVFVDLATNPALNVNIRGNAGDQRWGAFNVTKLT